MSTFKEAYDEFMTAAQADAPDTDKKLLAMVAAACQPPVVGAVADEKECLEKCKTDLTELAADNKPAKKSAAVGAGLDWRSLFKLALPFILQLLDGWLNPKPA
jgi:hypothetical protein